MDEFSAMASEKINDEENRDFFFFFTLFWWGSAGKQHSRAVYLTSSYPPFLCSSFKASLQEIKTDEDDDGDDDGDDDEKAVSTVPSLHHD